MILTRENYTMSLVCVHEFKKEIEDIGKFIEH